MINENLIINDYRNGLSSLKIAKKYNISKSKVLSILTKNGVERRKHGVSITSKQEEIVLTLYKDKEEIKKIVEKTGIPRRRVYEILNTHGIVRHFNKKITESAKINICKDFLDGKTFEDIALEYNIKSTGTISKILKENNIIVQKKIHNKIDEKIVNKVVNEYKNGLSICELRDIYGYGTSTIARWIRKAGVTRNLSDAFSLSSIKGRKHFRGTNLPWFSIKNNKWFVADSLWEAVRMEQLDNDVKVLSWEKGVDRIEYFDMYGKKHYYIPDFKIFYINNIIVEEVKPYNQIQLPINIIKFDAAKKYYENLGIKYKIVTENEIGVDNIKNFSPNNFITYTQEMRKEKKRILKNKRERERRRNAKLNNKPQSSNVLTRN